MEPNSQNPEQVQKPEQVDFRREPEAVEGQPEPLAPVEATLSAEASLAPAPVTPSATVDLPQALPSVPPDTETTDASLSSTTKEEQLPQIETKPNGALDAKPVEDLIGNN